MKPSTFILASISSKNIKKNNRILNHTGNSNIQQAKLAKKEYKRLIIITILIILLSMIPVFESILLILNPNYPPGATKEIYGQVSFTKDIFWYRIGKQKYEFYLDEYNIDDSYKPGEKFLIYLDDNNNIISFSHQTTDDITMLIINIFKMSIILIVLLTVNIILAKKFYAKNWVLYNLWYQKEIEPYRFQDNFREIVANKQYYDVTENIGKISPANRKLYNKYRNKAILYTLLFICCIGLTIYFGTEFDLNPNSWLLKAIIIIYVIVFLVLINNCDVEMSKIRYEDDDNK